MSVAVHLDPAILDTALSRLALLFLGGAHGDLTAARQAASRMLAAYGAKTEDELRLAAEIISFGFHALEALSQACDPGLTLAKILRLRGSAVSLSRESHKSQRRLDQLQRDRRAGTSAHPEISAPPPVAEPARPQIDKAIALIETTRQITAAKGSDGVKSRAQSFQQRLTASRIASNLKKNQAAHAARSDPSSEAAAAPG
jgi:hypothetical protein